MPPLVPGDFRPEHASELTSFISRLISLLADLRIDITIMSLRPTIKPGQSKFRIEKDTFGDLEVPADKYYGCQTQR